MGILAFVGGVVVGWLLGGACHNIAAGHAYLIEHMLRRWFRRR